MRFNDLKLPPTLGRSSTNLSSVFSSPAPVVVFVRMQAVFITKHGVLCRFRGREQRKPEGRKATASNGLSVARRTTCSFLRTQQNGAFKCRSVEGV